MSVKMMPPKKSKAARSDNLDTTVEEKPVEPEPEPTSASEEPDDAPVTGLPPKKKPFNIFDVTTVEGKRKRNVSTPETSLNEWVQDHFEEKSGVKLPVGEVYNIYLEKCVAEASTALEPVFFNRILRQQFPNGFTFKPGSPFVDRVKEKKVKKKETKVKADTLTLKIRDIIQNSLNDMGNPKGGVRFNKLVAYVAGKYPALRIELRPKMLLTALQRGIRYGYLVCERGIGKCGFYRCYVENEPEKEEVKNNKEKNDKDTKEGEGEDKEEEKSADESADDTKEKEKKEDDKEEKEEQNGKAAVKKKAKKKTPRQRFIHHGDPGRVEDTFYLAMTFMSEPKEASVVRIKKYVAENYPDTNVDRLGRCLEAGKERGYWEQVSGSGNNGRFRLEVDSFDPTDDEDMTGMVINAIMACTEPKMCSANLLKKYVVEWYAEKFKVAERPHLFKKALERAISNQEIKQLSGIGASGTFQLCKSFTPSPNILAGQDTPSDYEVEDSETSDEEAVESYDFTGYGDKYKPRPSKRRGMARVKAVHAKPAVEVNEELVTKRKRKAARKAAAKSRKRSRAGDSDSEESSEESSSEDSDSEESEEEEAPPKKRGSARAPASPAKKRNASPAKKTPAKRGGASKSRSATAESNAKPTSKTRNRKRTSYREDSSDEDSDAGPKVVDGYRPTPSKSRGGTQARSSPSPAPKRERKPPAKRGRERAPAPAPQPTPGRVRTPAAKKQGDDVRYDSDSDSSASEKPPPPPPRVETPAAKKQRSATAPKARGRRR